MKRVTEIVSDGSSSERIVRKAIEECPPLLPIGDGETIHLYAAAKVESSVKPAVHGVAVCIDRGQNGKQTFRHGSAGERDSWADRAQFGAALSALAWLDLHAPRAAGIVWLTDWEGVFRWGVEKWKLASEPFDMDTPIIPAETPRADLLHKLHGFMARYPNTEFRKVEPPKRSRKKDAEKHPWHIAVDEAEQARVEARQDAALRGAAE